MLYMVIMDLLQKKYNTKGFIKNTDNKSNIEGNKILNHGLQGKFVFVKTPHPNLKFTSWFQYVEIIPFYKYLAQVFLAL